MNNDHKEYSNYKSISDDWPLDDWSITKECFDKIVEVLPFGKTILEIGSGKSTGILSKFYKMISLESNRDWMNKFESEYHYIPLQKMNSAVFGETTWLDVDALTSSIQHKNYDMLLVDAGGDRVGILDHIQLFKTDIPIIFDDTMNDGYLKCAELVASKLNRTCVTYTCKRNKYAVVWFDGKKYSLIV